MKFYLSYQNVKWKYYQYLIYQVVVDNNFSFINRTMTREDVAIIQERRMSQQSQSKFLKFVKFIILNIYITDFGFMRCFIVI